MSYIKYQRRDFLIKTGQVALGFGAAQVLGIDQLFALENKILDLQPFSIIQGVTTDTQTQITIDVPAGLNLSYQLLEVNTLKSYEPAYLAVTDLQYIPWTVHNIMFNGLSPYQDYLLQVLNAEGQVVDQRELRTIDMSKASPRVAFISCARDRYKNASIWKNVLVAKPDLLVFMGDNVYCDDNVEASPSGLVQRYIESRSKVAFYHQKSLVPVIAIWDDHDYGHNDDNQDYAHKEHSLKMFNAFYGRQDVGGEYVKGPGVASVFRAFGIQFLLLDGRYFRSHHKNKKGSMLGAEQTAWALQKVREFNGPTWLVEGSQFFGEFNLGESFEGNFKKDFHNFLDGLKSTNRTVMFAAGDVHHSETMDIEKDFLGYKTVELTSSGIHSRHFPIMLPNKRRRKSTPDHNFVCVDHTKNSDHLVLNFTSIGRKEVEFKDQFTLPLMTET